MKNSFLEAMKKYLLILLGACLFAACDEASEKQGPATMTPENSTPLPLQPLYVHLDANKGGACTFHVATLDGEEVPTIFDATYVYQDNFSEGIRDASYKEEELPAEYDCSWYTVTQLDSSHYEVIVRPSDRRGERLSISINPDRSKPMRANWHWHTTSFSIYLE